MTMCMVMTNPDVRALHHYKLVGLVKSSVQLKNFRKQLNRVISPADAFAGWTRSTEYREALNKRA
ncbi:hypothetical protein MKX60_29830 [Paenibacillus sp. FSL R5-0914]|uniref:hypothetical protein n=1 Tax=Paenibacillus sp. FSL R5-0914 TaxID=2921665 RepID=UPI0030F86F2E